MSIDIYSTSPAPFANHFNTVSLQGKSSGGMVSNLVDPNDIFECSPLGLNQPAQNQGSWYTLESLMRLILSLLSRLRPAVPDRHEEYMPSYGNHCNDDHGGQGGHGAGKYGHGGHGGRGGHGTDGGIPHGNGSHGNGHHGHGGGKGGSQGSGTAGNIGKPVGGGIEFQASHKDSMTKAGNIGGRSDVVRIGFNEGRLTANSTSPRAEVKHGANLKEGSTYNVKFGYMREKNTDTTLWQVLDHNGSKPKPRAWISTTNGEYVLHLRENGDKNGGVKKYNLGPARAGKWDDFDIDFKRGKGNGSIDVKINGRSVFHKEGISTMFDNNSTNAYFKYGQYRNQGDRSPAAVYYSGFRVSER